CGAVPPEKFLLRYEVTRLPAPWPSPTTMSAKTSPSRFLAATRTPPRLFGSPAKKLANGVSTAATAPCAADDVRHAVAVHIADRHIGPVPQRRIEEEKVVHGMNEIARGKGGAVVHGNAGTAGEPGRDHEVGEPVPV